MAEQKSVRKQLSFWLPPWKGPSAKEPQRQQSQQSVSMAEASSSSQPPEAVQYQSSPEDQHQAKVEDVAASDRQPATAPTTASPRSSPPQSSRKEATPPDMEPARSQRSSASHGRTRPSTIPGQRSKPAARQTPSSSRLIGRGASPSSRPTPSKGISDLKDLARTASGSTSKDHHSTQSLESEPLSSKASQPNQVPEKEGIDMNETSDKSSNQKLDLGATGHLVPHDPTIDDGVKPQGTLRGGHVNTAETEPMKKKEDKRSSEKQEEKTETTKPATQESDPEPIRVHSDSTTTNLVGITETKQPAERSTPTRAQKEVVLAAPQKCGKRKGESASLQKGIKNDVVPKLVQDLGIMDPQQMEGERSICIVTLAGENKGASMVINHACDGNDVVGSSVPIHKAYDHGNPSHQEEKRHAENSTRRGNGESPKVEANINGNTQCINNSILQTSSCSERSPGVYFILDEKKPCKLVAWETSRASRDKSSTFLPQQLTHDPSSAVRRRCLRGLLAESSESDDAATAGGTKKPPRHGCRFRCD